MNSSIEELLPLAHRVVELAIKKGVDVAEVSAGQGWELSAKVRLGEVELVEEAGHKSLSLRVRRDDRVAASSTSDLRAEGLEQCVQHASELLDLSEPDPDSRPADPSEHCKNTPADLKLFDESLERLDTDQAINLARSAEQAALRHDPRLKLSEGAVFGRATGETVLVFSNGFEGTRRGTQASLAVSPVVEDTGGKRRRGHYYTAHRYFDQLESAQIVGETAAIRTLEQLGAKSVATCEAAVVFHPDAARSILGTFAECIMGGALWRRSSYLLDRIGTPVASPLVSLVDDPSRPCGFGSRVFDGEGLACRVNKVVEDGVYLSPLLDCTSARKLGMSSTGSASRHGAQVSPSISNFVMQTGALTPDSIISNTGKGLYVTSMMGFGFNPVTGDFSRGASGFWIEDGKFVHPVSEVTISANLDGMLKNIDAVGNDCIVRSSIIAPTFRVSSMTIAGQSE
jgi:PmbA protein